MNSNHDRMVQLSVESLMCGNVLVETDGITGAEVPDFLLQRESSGQSSCIKHDININQQQGSHWSVNQREMAQEPGRNHK